MKFLLRHDLVRYLTLANTPVGIDGEGKLIFEPNVKGAPYILYDTHRKAPVGFGVKVAKTKITYIVQRRVPKGKPIKFTVGNFKDFLTIDEAREAAHKKSQVAQSTSRNPNKIVKLKLASEYTLLEAFNLYRGYLLAKRKPATENTLSALNKGMRKVSEWHNTVVSDISLRSINSKFDSLYNIFPTATEQAFRWANAAVNYLIEYEMHQSKVSNRDPSITYNPFSILHFNNKYRSKSELEESYKAKGVRRPLNDSNLTKWLNAITIRRKSSTSPGPDFLLLSTLWGTRKNEISKLKWKALLSSEEIANSSYVDLENQSVLFRDTKNRTDHELPLTLGTLNVLKNRFYSIDKKNKNHKWVFPAASKNSKYGFYSDPSELLENICKEASIDKFTMHDLRRTFGKIADQNTTYRTVKRLLNHTDNSDPTLRYTISEWEFIQTELEKIEVNILQKSPLTFNELLTPKYNKI